MLNVVAVGLAEVKWSTSPEDILVAFSLGSCVGIAVWDPERRAGGMAHVVLPSRRVEAVDVPGKYADTAVSYLLQGVVGTRDDPGRLKVWLAGGAHVLKGMDLPGGDIGSANVRAVEEALKAYGIQAPRKEVGEDYGRTMRLYIADGRATVYSVLRGEKDV